MKVYRYLSETELNNLLEGNKAKLGASFVSKRILLKKYNRKVNNHRYNPKEKYLHFFKDLADIEHIRQEHRTDEGNFYFVQFEIPKLVLFFAAGKGYYNTLHGYDSFVESIREYAVMVKNFNPNWLVGYTLDKNKQTFMHEEDYINLQFKQRANQTKTK